MLLRHNLPHNRVVGPVRNLSFILPLNQVHSPVHALAVSLPRNHQLNHLLSQSLVQLHSRRVNRLGSLRSCHNLILLRGHRANRLQNLRSNPPLLLRWLQHLNHLLNHPHTLLRYHHVPRLLLHLCFLPCLHLPLLLTDPQDLQRSGLQYSLVAHPLSARVRFPRLSQRLFRLTFLQ